MADCWEDVIRGSGEMFIEGEEIVYQSPSKRLLPEECQAPLHMDASLTIDPRPLPKDAVISSQFFSYQERQFVWSNLNDRGMIHGRVHLAVLRDADVRGLIVDVLIVDDDDDTSLKSSLDSHAAYVWQHLISRREAARDPNRVARGGIGDTYGDPSRWHVWSGCFMKWHFLQPHNNVPAEEKMEAARRTMPPGTTFMVYATQFTPRNGLRCKPGYHSFPVFAFPRSLLYRPIITKTRPRYLFVMDFEATCDFAPHPLITPATAEITEFPWVILDLWQLQNGVDPTKPSLEKFGVVGQKQLYVTPSGGQAAITKYCTALTGISWKECGPSNPKAMPLSRAIERFNDLFRRYDDDGGAAVVTDGVWDIQVQLRGEAERKGIVLPQHFRQYFDLKAEFRRIFPNFSFNQREPPLFVMLQAFSLHFCGRHHSGIDDCFSIVQLVRALLAVDPSAMNWNSITRVPADYDPHKDESWMHFTGVCPSNSWLCPSCDVWNKPRLSVCNFCQFDATYSDNLEVYLSDEEQDGYDEDEERSDLLADEDRLAAQYDIKDLL